MGLKVKWTITCDHCGRVVETERCLGQDDISSTTWFDEWGPGIPDGWIQMPYDELTGRRYLFFHDEACIVTWLEEQSRVKEAADFCTGIWVA